MTRAEASELCSHWSVKAFVAEPRLLMSLICIVEGVVWCKMYAYNQLKYIQMSDTAMTL